MALTHRGINAGQVCVTRLALILYRSSLVFWSEQALVLGVNYYNASRAELGQPLASLTPRQSWTAGVTATESDHCRLGRRAKSATAASQPAALTHSFTPAPASQHIGLGTISPAREAQMKAGPAPTAPQWLTLFSPPTHACIKTTLKPISQWVSLVPRQL